MADFNRQLIEYYIEAHKNIWRYVRKEIYNGSKLDIDSLKIEACRLNGYDFRGCCALCELTSVIGCECNICFVITGIPQIRCECLGGLYNNMRNACTVKKQLRLKLANMILHCVDNWEENAKKGGLI